MSPSKGDRDPVPIPETSSNVVLQAKSWPPSPVLRDANRPGWFTSSQIPLPQLTSDSVGSAPSFGSRPGAYRHLRPSLSSRPVIRRQPSPSRRSPRVVTSLPFPDIIPVRWLASILSSCPVTRKHLPPSLRSRPVVRTVVPSRRPPRDVALLPFPDVIRLRWLASFLQRPSCSA
ncbi:hypothetical protein B0H34DRAFT_716117 [Crassisporium funariophilum]|nr:hypothetical protein B0H34DRAFT_716117 [Crassisporium funariophilum]